MTLLINNLIAKLYIIMPSPIKKIWDKVGQSDIGSRMAKGAFWSLVGSVISSGLMLLASIIVARILGKTQFGELGMIRSTVNMFVVFAGFGLGLTATKYVAEFRDKDKVKSGKIIGLSTIFAGVSGAIIAIFILLFSPYLASETINAPHLVNELRLGAFMLFFSALNGAQTGILAGFEAFKAITKVNMISGLLAFPVQIIFTWFWGLTGSVIGYGTNFIFRWFLNYIEVRKESQKFNINIDFFNSWSEWRVLYKYSLPALLSGLLVNPVVWAGNAILVNQPNGYEEMAIYDAANQWRGAILFVPVALSQIILPMLSNTSNTPLKFIQIIKINLTINLIISLFLSIIISIIATPILKSYGEGFEDGKFVLIILAISTILISLNNVIGKIIASKNKLWYGLLLNLFWAIVLLGFTYFFIKNGYGAKGMAIAFLISYIFHTGSQSLIAFLILKNKI